MQASPVSEVKAESGNLQIQRLRWADLQVDLAQALTKAFG